MRILLIQGANMEYLGFRQPEIYGTTTAAELDDILRADAVGLGMQLDILYTNVEGEAISAIYRATREQVDGLVMNPAGFLYAGHALRDCLKAVPLPYIEVHMSNIDARGMHSVTASESAGMVTGLGVDSYRLALVAIQKVIHKRNKHA
ncbi:MULTISPECIES: type II 3-dehydroquinate dehydratase [Cupriavidus]|jgi:3-dehydroquinate dehydratase-2|uniref:3-dehydroquinate dehydratase n=1 Tax=Cupriavidus basilensis TaxID=68895 RepID=A0A643G0S9_9BURK|nr:MULTISPECIES: type II 3-dehydroquinate dehydratase [Cupriavidus]KUE87995.1 3-dehydroquinate dehydratase [Cupriavidus necator]NOV23766.1 3-dehydroquinate dehydratase [Cupriavidus necator]QOT81819.1 3-dehydroquinate dehydratase [Cupriavidus basilensis]BDB30326.1 3-dehydroquinate dehydratase [Cupriavidus sp. P-10]